jgi:hypothetical protein
VATATWGEPEDGSRRKLREARRRSANAAEQFARGDPPKIRIATSPGSCKSFVTPARGGRSPAPKGPARRVANLDLSGPGLLRVGYSAWRARYLLAAGDRHSAAGYSGYRPTILRRAWPRSPRVAARTGRSWERALQHLPAISAWLRRTLASGGLAAVAGTARPARQHRIRVKCWPSGCLTPRRFLARPRAARHGRVHKYDGMRLLSAHRNRCWRDRAVHSAARRRREQTQFPPNVVCKLLQTGLGPREAILER